MVSEQSFEGYRKQTLGGLISSEISGLLVHTNTIEEYEAFDFQNRLWIFMELMDGGAFTPMLEDL